MPYEFTQQYIRNKNDFYVEPTWAVKALISKVKFEGTVHDPACGTGTIPIAFSEEKNWVTGSDIVDRGFGLVKDFFSDHAMHDNIVTNPPFNLIEYFINYGLKHIKYRMAILARLTFLESQKRYSLFSKDPPEQVIVLSRRPSMPPGGMNINPQGGKTAFCWIVWNKQNTNLTILKWAL